MRHSKIAKAFRLAIRAMNLDLIPISEKVSANTMTAPYFPEGVSGGELLGGISKAGVIVAGGLLSEIKTKYFRVGHMGSVNRSDILATISALEYALKKCGFEIQSGEGLKAAQEVLDE